MVATIVVSWVGAVFLAWFTWDLLSAIPDRDHLRRVGDMAQATTLLDRQDRAVFTIFTEQRIEIPLAQISPLLVKAIVSVEDQRFYEHQGVDTVRIAAAALTNLREGRRAQGGSTLTQQLARQAFLTLDKSYVRKLKEVIVAAELEAEYSKDEILELYLNKVYFGDGLHGVEAASLGFFGKHASDLTLAEAALIAGLVKSPSAYAPTVNLKRAITRRDLVLQTMVDSRAITAAEAATGQGATGSAQEHARPRRPVRRLVQGGSPAAADRALRPGPRVRGRPEGLHDRGHGDAAGGRTAGRRRA